MNIRALGYIVVEATDIDEWRRYGTEILGLAISPGTESDRLHLKMDDQPYRLAVVSGDKDRLLCSGWQVPDSSALDQAVAELTSVGIETRECSADVAAERRAGRVVVLGLPSQVHGQRTL